MVTHHVCWQHKINRRNARLRIPALVLNGTAGVAVSELPFAVARSFIEQYEWLGNIGAAKYCYGLLVDGALASVVCYTTPSSPIAYRSLLGSDFVATAFQLCRGATAYWAPKWAASKTISGSLKMLRRREGADLVIAYADPRAGEIGAVYQAANALYLGLTDSRGPGKYVIGGGEYHARAVQKHFGSAAHDYLVEVDPHYRRIQRTKKHRYCFVLARGIRRRTVLERVAHLIHPFPKRRLVPTRNTVVA